MWSISHTVIGQFSRKSKGAHAIHFGIISDLDFIWIHFRIRIKIWDQSVFLPRDDIHGAAYVIVGCPFVCLSGSCIVSKWINILKHFIAPDIDIDRTIAILSVRPSVCLSLRHAPVLYRNGLTYHNTVFTTW